MNTHLIYELVDSTSEESYYPLGIFTDLAELIQAAQQHDPSSWDHYEDAGRAVAEIRARRHGLFGDEYSILWRCTWIREEVADDDLWPGPWVHGTIETGTLEKPLSRLP